MTTTSNGKTTTSSSAGPTMRQSLTTSTISRRATIQAARQVPCGGGQCGRTMGAARAVGTGAAGGVSGSGARPRHGILHGAQPAAELAAQEMAKNQHTAMIAYFRPSQ